VGLKPKTRAFVNALDEEVGRFRGFLRCCEN
jgi:hypothetical protein